ncbi:MAG: DUF455 family protein [Planctomycetota bacterium]
MAGAGTQRQDAQSRARWCTRRSGRNCCIHLAHHELQAAEMFAWALLAFPETPLAFRQGLWRLLRSEELGHLALYLQRLAALGTRFGDEPVRDWFWSRLGSVQTPVEFVAFLGLGLEGANLEHAQRFFPMDARGRGRGHGQRARSGRAG